MAINASSRALRRLWGVLACVGLLVALPYLPAGAQPAGEEPAAVDGAAAPEQVVDPDAFVDFEIDRLQPDFTIVGLPTTLRVPARHLAFRVTHRFTRPLGQGTFGSLLADLFGLDSAARIGLELRYGLVAGTQIGIHRTSDRTIQLFGQHNALRERDGHPVGLDVLVTVEGLDNFRERYAPALGVIVSRSFSDRAAGYIEPIWVGNANLLPGAPGGRHTLMLGLGGRLRFRPTAYLVGEMAPRLAGFDPDVFHASFGIEKLAGGHLFQLNFSNGFGTTMAQVARGALTHRDWRIGFNISRKFY